MRIATAQRIPFWRVEEWLDDRDLQQLEQCNRHLHVRMTGPVGLRSPAAGLLLCVFAGVLLEY